MKNLIVASLFAMICVAFSSCEKKTTVIKEVEKPKEEEPGFQFKVKSNESGVEVDIEGKTEPDKNKK